MLRSSHKGTILILEGSTDSRVYSKFINGNECKIIVASGKWCAISTLMILKNSMDGVIAIVDADFWKIINICPISSNIFLTDTHDLETMICCSNAIDGIETEFCQSRKIRKLMKSFKDTITELVLPIGYLRWLCSVYRYNYEMKFNGMDFNNFLNLSNFTISIDNLINELKTNSAIHLDKEAIIKSELNQHLRSKPFDCWQICHGHDYVKVLSLFIINHGNHRGKNLTYDIIDGIIRFNYNLLSFQKTTLFRDMKKWEQNNPPYIILI